MGDTWASRLRSVWPYAVFASVLCFLSTGGVGAFVAWRGGASDSLSFALALLDPALATLAFLGVSVAVPTVFVGKPYNLVHALTLPTVFLSLIYGIKSMGRFSGANAQRIEDALRTDLMWLVPAVVFQAWIVTVLVFLFVGAVVPKGGDVE
jgi:hypothetical protein